MPVTYTNRRGQLYHLHVGVTKSGKPRYWFSMKTDGDLVDAIPEGFEVYENPNNQVFLRKRKPQVVTTAEVAVVENGLKRFAPGQNCIVDLRDKHIVVYHADRIEFDSRIFGLKFPFSEPPVSYGSYTAVMRFTLANEKARTFHVQRWCFRGSIDDWIDLPMSGRSGDLADLVRKFAPHIGQESFFELI